SFSEYRFFENAFINDSLLNQHSLNNTNGYTISSNIAYTEPIGKSGQLQINYTPSYSKNKADQQTFLFDNAVEKYSRFDTILSNKFDNTVTTQNAAISYRLGRSRDNQFAAGANFQYSRLQSDRTFPTATSVNQSFANILPNLLWRKKISGKSTINILYRA